MDIHDYWQRFEAWRAAYDNYDTETDSLEELCHQAICELTEERNKIERAKALAREFIRKADTRDYGGDAGGCGEQLLSLLEK